MKKSIDNRTYAIKLFKDNNGLLQTAQTIEFGIYPKTLYALRDEGVIEELSRGLYRLSDLPPLSHSDIFTVSIRAPHSVVCLISALAFHEITTEIARKVHIAVDRNMMSPQIDYPPTKVYRFSNSAFSEGIETHKLNGRSVKIYSVEKTLADCFKYRNKIGMDTVLEALRFYTQRKKINVKQIMKYASVCRVKKIMTPYLEALV